MGRRQGIKLPYSIAYANEVGGIQDLPELIAGELGVHSRRLDIQPIRTKKIRDAVSNSIFNPYGKTSSFQSVVDFSQNVADTNLILLPSSVGLKPFPQVPPYPYVVYMSFYADKPPLQTFTEITLYILRQEHFRAGQSAAGDPLTFRKGPHYYSISSSAGPIQPEKRAKHLAAGGAADIIKEHVPELRFEGDRYKGIKLCPEIRDKLEELKQLLSSSLPGPITGSRHGIGGNNPPELIDEDFRALLSGQFRSQNNSPEIAVSAGLDAVDSAETALRKSPKPDPGELSKLRKMLLAGVTLFSGSFVVKLGENSANWLTENAAAIWVELGNLFLKLDDVIERIIKAL